MVVAAVYLGGVKVFGKVGQVIGRFQVFGVKNAFPGVAPARGADVQVVAHEVEGSEDGTWAYVKERGRLV